MRLLHKGNFNKYVALNSIQGRTGVRFCDAESSSARRKIACALVSHKERAPDEAQLVRLRCEVEFCLKL